MKYAVILSGGKQYKVAEGDTIAVDRLNLKPQDAYTFSDVLLYVADGARQVGTPTVPGVVVSATVLEEKKTQKVRVATFKAKAKYRRVRGHRSIVTLIKVEKIESGKAAKSAEK